MSDLTPSQTIGPFFHGGADWLIHNSALPKGWVNVRGKVLDLDAKPVSDALLEFSLPAAHAAPDGPRYQRVFTSDEGAFGFVMPSAHPIHVCIFARGLLRQVFTRVYLSAQDVPAEVPGARRDTLVAKASDGEYRWNVRLRGDDETVFFELR